MVPKWKSGEVSRRDVIIVNPGIIPGLRKKAGNNLEVANGLRYYTLGKEHSSMW
jgi:hypothetical protein